MTLVRSVAEKKKLYVGAAIGVVLTVLVGLAGPAAAGTNARVRTTDADPGGEGYFQHYGDVVKACDIQADGYGVYARIWTSSDIYEVRDRDGANGNCASRSYSEIAEGARVGLEVCLTTNGGANLHFCSSTTATA